MAFQSITNSKNKTKIVTRVVCRKKKLLFSFLFFVQTPKLLNDISLPFLLFFFFSLFTPLHHKLSRFARKPRYICERPKISHYVADDATADENYSRPYRSRRRASNTDDVQTTLGGAHFCVAERLKR